MGWGAAPCPPRVLLGLWPLSPGLSLVPSRASGGPRCSDMAALVMPLSVLQRPGFRRGERQATQQGKGQCRLSGPLDPDGGLEDRRGCRWRARGPARRDEGGCRQRRLLPGEQGERAPWHPGPPVLPRSGSCAVDLRSPARGSGKDSRGTQVCRPSSGWRGTGVGSEAAHGAGAGSRCLGPLP